MKNTPAARRALLLALSAMMTSALTPFAWSAGFEVVKNVNAANPLDEKIVLFDKAKPVAHLTFVDKPDCKITPQSDGALEIRITGSAEIQPLIRWKPESGIPATLNASDYQYLVLTCRLEGTTRQTNPNGSVTDNRPDNLWFSATMLNAQNQRVGLANLADVAPDQKTPSQTVTLKIPMLFFNKGKKDSTTVNAIGFYWSGTRPNMNRDFKLIIDRISLAN